MNAAAGSSSPTRVWATIARREFVERARDRGFVISTAITLLILSGFIVASAIFDPQARLRSCALLADACLHDPRH